MIPLEWEMVLSALLFVIGLYGVLVRTNAIVVLMSVEIMFNAPILNLVAFSAYLGDPAGQMFALVAIALAAGEAAVGLAIFLVLYETHGTVDLSRVRLLRW
ncbi:MAG TPA: NADH-quinone oxidoreductase subunit NuoK [Thermoplasmata archaeon]|jgi:NADH-quinone oxidoreductase subunit K|nr:NADH-quinone oxidoreductase subunit NuoK [Thermoplasmata archaeon]